MSKKGKTLMTFVQVSGEPTRHEAEELTKLWQSALWNNHIQAERFLITTVPIVLVINKLN